MQMNSLMRKGNSAYCIHMFTQVSQLLFAYKVLIKFIIDIIVLKDGSVLLFITLVGQEKY